MVINEPLSARCEDSNKNQDHKRQQKAYGECSGVRWRLAGMVMAVIPHESQAGARKARRRVHAAMGRDARPEAAHSRAQADATLAEIQGEGTETRSLSEVEAHEFLTLLSVKLSDKPKTAWFQQK